METLTKIELIALIYSMHFSTKEIVYDIVKIILTVDTSSLYADQRLATLLSLYREKVEVSPEDGKDFEGDARLLYNLIMDINKGRIRLEFMS